MNEKYYILDDVISLEECLYLYHELQVTPSWSLTRTSMNVHGNMKQFKSFPGLHIETNEVIHHDFFSGYFRSLVFRVRQLVKKRYGLHLPGRIQRIHLGAKNSQSHTEFHVDSKSENAWTILGFLNPVWNTQDGGEFYIEDIKIDYKTARFVVFKSNLNHNSGFITNEKLNNWRISLNVVLLD